MDEYVLALQRLLGDAPDRRKEVADVLGVSEQYLYQIARGIKLQSGKHRTVGRELRARLDERFPGWLTGAHIAEPPGRYSAPPTSGVAQPLSLLARTVVPKKIAWESLMSEPLQGEFETVMPDVSMSPEVPRGARIILTVGVVPEPGDYVLITDSDGSLYLREYKLLRPGHWQAHAVNPAFLPLDSERDGLRVLAVFDGMRGRRARA